MNEVVILFLLFLCVILGMLLTGREGPSKP
jgi:hypothetical protein